MPQQEQPTLSPEEARWLEMIVFEPRPSLTMPEHRRSKMPSEEERRLRQLILDPRADPITPRPQQTRMSPEDEHHLEDAFLEPPHLDSMQKEEDAGSLCSMDRVPGVPSHDEADEPQYPKTTTVSLESEEHRFEQKPTQQGAEASQSLAPTNVGPVMPFTPKVDRPPHPKVSQYEPEPTANPLPFELYAEVVAMLKKKRPDRDQAIESWKQHTVACLQVRRAGYLAHCKARINKLGDEYMHSLRAWMDSCQKLVAVGKDIDDAFAEEFCSDERVEEFRADWNAVQEEFARKRILVGINRRQLRKYRRQRYQLYLLDLTHESLELLDTIALAR